MGQMHTVVVVGAGHAGTNFAALLRQKSDDVNIVMFGAETHHPYERPPLSKNLGQSSVHEPLFSADFFVEQRIETRLGVRVETIDTAARAVHAGGEVISYDDLILATGAAARRLTVDGADLEGIRYLRSLDDALGLHGALQTTSHLVVVGGGWVGLEVASAARSLGVDVTVVEQGERLLARVGSPELSRWITDQHLRSGVTVRTGVEARSFLGDGLHVRSVLLSDGSRIECDGVVVGVGADPDVSLAKSAGVVCIGGIVVDEHARTSDKHIYAIGDGTVRPVLGQHSLLRLESIPSAIEQAQQAIATILGADAPDPQVPWFWSDQYSAKIRIAGLRGLDDVPVIRRSGAGDAMSVLHVRDGRLQAAETVNSVAEFMTARRLIREGSMVDVSRAHDPSVSLKDLVIAASP